MFGNCWSERRQRRETPDALSSILLFICRWDEGSHPERQTSRDCDNVKAAHWEQREPGTRKGVTMELYGAMWRRLKSTTRIHQHAPTTIWVHRSSWNLNLLTFFYKRTVVITQEWERCVYCIFGDLRKSLWQSVTHEAPLKTQNLHGGQRKLSGWRPTWQDR